MFVRLNRGHVRVQFKGETVNDGSNANHLQDYYGRINKRGHVALSSIQMSLKQRRFELWTELPSSANQLFCGSAKYLLCRFKNTWLSVSSMK
jgi:hypothetical protein